jgi:hypothetical protein
MLFDQNYMYKAKTSSQADDEVIDFNIGTKESSKMVKFGKGTISYERDKFIATIKEFKYVFSWSYEDLKAYREYVIDHAIPLKEGKKPFRQKLKQMNLKVAPQV